MVKKHEVYFVWSKVKLYRVTSQRNVTRGTHLMTASSSNWKNGKLGRGRQWYFNNSSVSMQVGLEIGTIRERLFSSRTVCVGWSSYVALVHNC